MPNTTNENCIIYCRVSVAKSAQEGESLDTQDSVMRRFVADRSWNILPNGRVFRETYSGRKDIRPVLEEVFDYLKKNPGKVKYFVFRVIDRFTRGGSYSYDSIKRRLASHGVEMVDTYGVIQPVKNTLDHLGFEYEWSKTSSSEIAETVIANTAKAEVTNILTRLIGREIELTKQGFKIRQAADGFINQRIILDGKKKVIQVPDPDRAKFYSEIFSLRAAGTHTDKEIVERINAMGFRSKMLNRWDRTHEKVIGVRGGFPLTVKHLQKIITRPIYCGLVCEKWTNNKPIKAQYEGLVSIDTFNRANRGKVFIKRDSDGFQVLYDHRPVKHTATHSRTNPLFPYKNMVLCDSCRRNFTGSSPRGKSGQRFPIYHCARGHKYIGIPKTRFDADFQAFVGRIRLKPETFEAIEASLLSKYQDREAEIVRLTSEIQQTVAELKIEQKAKMDAFVVTTSSVLRSRLEFEIEELEAKIKSAGSEDLKIGISEGDIVRFKKYGKYCLEHLSELLINPEDKRLQHTIFTLFLEELPTYENIINGTPKMAQIFTLLPEIIKNDITVPSEGLSWNAIINTICQWNEAFANHTILDKCHQNRPAKEGFG